MGCGFCREFYLKCVSLICFGFGFWEVKNNTKNEECREEMLLVIRVARFKLLVYLLVLLNAAISSSVMCLFCTNFENDSQKLSVNSD